MTLFLHSLVRGAHVGDSCSRRSTASIVAPGRGRHIKVRQLMVGAIIEPPALDGAGVRIDGAQYVRCVLEDFNVHGRAIVVKHQPSSGCAVVGNRDDKATLGAIATNIDACVLWVGGKLEVQPEQVRKARPTLGYRWELCWWLCLGHESSNGWHQGVKDGLRPHRVRGVKLGYLGAPHGRGTATSRLCERHLCSGMAAASSTARTSDMNADTKTPSFSSGARAICDR